MLERIAVGIGLFAATVMVAEPLLAYRRLPASMPLHYGLDGAPGTFAPKAVFVALFAAIAIVLASSAVALYGSGRPSDAGVVPIAASTAFGAYVEHTIVGLALRGQTRFPVSRVWIGLAVMTVVCVVAAR